MSNLFLSRLKLNPRNHQTLRDLGNCQDLHRTLLKGFPQTDSESARQHFGLLYRTEHDGRGGAMLLVQSLVDPDWSQLPEMYLLEPAASKSIVALYARLHAGQQLVFRLRANPTKRLPLLIENRIGRERGKRVEIFGEENQLEWLARKAGKHGFRLLTARVNPNVVNARANTEGKVIGWRGRSGPPMKFGSALFEGELEIADAEAFKRTLSEGIGSGKAYGFGLLSVAPAR